MAQRSCIQRYDLCPQGGYSPLPGASTRLTKLSEHLSNLDSDHSICAHSLPATYPPCPPKGACVPCTGPWLITAGGPGFSPSLPSGLFLHDLLCPPGLPGHSLFSCPTLFFSSACGTNRYLYIYLFFICPRSWHTSSRDVVLLVHSWVPSPGAGFVNRSMTDSLDQIILRRGDCAVHCKMVSIILAPCLDASSTVSPPPPPPRCSVSSG